MLTWRVFCEMCDDFDQTGIASRDEAVTLGEAHAEACLASPNEYRFRVQGIRRIMTGTAEDNEIAHIVHPSSKLHSVNVGATSKAKALCGVFVTRGIGSEAPVCRQCFEQYRIKDEPEDVAAEGGR